MMIFAARIFLLRIHSIQNVCAQNKMSYLDLGKFDVNLISR